MASSYTSTIQTAGAAASPAGSRLSKAAYRFFARCVQGLTWRRVAVVTAFSAIYGAVLSLNPATLGPPQSLTAYATGFVAALTYFLPVFLIVTVTANFAPRQVLQRVLLLASTVVVGIAIGYYLVTGMQELIVAWHVEPPRHTRAPMVLLLLCWLGLAVILLMERDLEAGRALLECEERRLNVGRQVAEAQLRVLQSQIEPHFLFNSLAHVRRLYRANPRAGRAMIRDLSRYLSTALPALREAGISLGEDVDLAIAYLNIQKIRMGERLAFEVDIAPGARGARVPPLMITTLAENAIKHGLSPLPEGGMVRVVARRNASTARIEVSDTGQGFQSSQGAGVGLANIRGRLATLHGQPAELSLSHNTPRGVIATIVVPV
jgi:sensor histidine kinase YesM